MLDLFRELDEDKDGVINKDWRKGMKKLALTCRMTSWTRLLMRLIQTIREDDRVQGT